MRLLIVFLLFALIVTACERKKEEPATAKVPAVAKRPTMFVPNPDGRPLPLDRPGARDGRYPFSGGGSLHETGG